MQEVDEIILKEAGGEHVSENLLILKVYMNELHLALNEVRVSIWKNPFHKRLKYKIQNWILQRRQ